MFGIHPKSKRLNAKHSSHFGGTGRTAAKCDRACRRAETPADACTCVCKGKNHGSAHRRGMDDLFVQSTVIPAKAGIQDCTFIKLGKTRAA